MNQNEIINPLSDSNEERRLRTMADRWDKEWISYFNRAPGYFKDFSKPNADTKARLIAVKDALRIENQLKPNGAVSPENPLWRIWLIAAYPSEILNKSILDIGCGAGGIGRTIGHIVSDYIGIDYSPLALHVARIVSPPNCKYIARFEKKKIAQFAETRDLAFSRKVFIHQNFAQATELANVANSFLKPGGLLIADFWRPTKDINDPNQRGVTRLAKDELNPNVPSSGFVYTESELIELGQLTGFKYLNRITVPKENSEIVRFQKIK